jgi:hypothetical protein
VNSTPATVTLPADAARLLAVEVLLADPEALGNDALEGDLYILRDQLRGNPAHQPSPTPAAKGSPAAHLIPRAARPRGNPRVQPGSGSPRADE